MAPSEAPVGLIRESNAAAAAAPSRAGATAPRPPGARLEFEALCGSRLALSLERGGPNTEASADHLVAAGRAFAILEGTLRTAITATRTAVVDDITKLREAVMDDIKTLSRREADMKRVLEENDAKVKSTVARLEAQDNFLASTSRHITEDQEFMKKVVEQVTTGMGSQLAHSLAEQKNALSSLDQRVQPPRARRTQTRRAPPT